LEEANATLELARKREDEIAEKFEHALKILKDVEQCFDLSSVEDVM
jgi:hypothetical protein